MERRLRGKVLEDPGPKIPTPPPSLRGASYKSCEVTAERQRAVTEVPKDRQDKIAKFMAALTGAGEEPGTGASSSKGAQQQGMQGTETPINGDSTMHITDYTTTSRVPRGNFEKG